MPRQAALLLGIPTLALATLTPLFAQQAGAQGAAAREIQRREFVSNFASEAIANGNTAMANRDYESAFAYFKSAVDSLPSGGDATAEVRAEALAGFSEATVQLARQRISEGRFQDAETTVNVILQEQYAPDYGPALSLRAELKSPDTFNKTLTPGFVANVEEVKQLLREADGFYQSGEFDLAFKRCEQVLNIDKYNIAARRLMERVNNARENYGVAAYNATRSELLNDVEGAWELPVTKYDAGSSQIIEQPVLDTRGTASLTRKLADIRIPSINFREATVREAIDFIKLRAKQLDTAESDAANRGVNIVLKLGPGSQAAESSTRITLQLSDASLGDALTYIARAANLKVKVEPYAVAIVPLSEPTDVLVLKEYKVSPGFIESAPAGEPAEAGGFGFGAAATAAPTVSRSGAKEFLESRGVAFPTGASANYLPSSSKLIVRNTQPNIDLIDQLVGNDSDVPTQVEIEARFVEVTQNNLKELGFDWLLGQFAMPFGSGVYGGGGTSGLGQTINGTQTNLEGRTINSAFPFQSVGTPIGGSSTDNTAGPLTGGNRTGGAAISVNALDGLLFGSPVGPAPGVLALAGVFTNPQFQVVLRAINQKKGIDLMTAPKVLTKSGKRATVQVVREFRYPTQFDPPQIPQSIGSGGGFTPVTPTTPSGFETRNLGVELEVEPTIGPDGFTIDLNLSPRVTEFDGFINYGSPIFTTATNSTTTLDAFGFLVGQDTGESAAVLVSENVINQPVFSVRQVTTMVTVYDGETVVLGGLMREDVQKVEDKTPIIGDIPLVGRLFRSSADQHIKRNLIMFVTAALLDPAGQPLIKQVIDDEEVAATDAAVVRGELVPGDPLSNPDLLPPL